MLMSGLVLERLLHIGAALRLVAGEGGVVRARLPAGLVALVEAAAGAALVAQLLAAVVEARVVDRAVHRRAELADLTLAEVPAHRDDAQVGLRRGAAGLLGRQPGPAGEAERLAGLGDAVEGVLGQSLPDAGRLLVLALLARDVVAAEQEMIGFVGHSR
jgi:hypothetical protein